MKISLSGTGKRYNREWIFRHLHFEFSAPQFYAITGPNGSGKSTLLQTISGALQPSEGKVVFSKNDVAVSSEKMYQFVSLCAPYLEVIEEMTLLEFFQFHQQFKPLLPGINVLEIIHLLGLEKAAKKQIRYYSSGMKQRVKLAQAFFSLSPILLLDEPCTNLDAAGISLYQQLIENYCKDRLVIISSNDPVEYNFCTQIINISDFKNVAALRQ